MMCVIVICMCNSVSITITKKSGCNIAQVSFSDPNLFSYEVMGTSRVGGKSRRYSPLENQKTFSYLGAFFLVIRGPFLHVGGLFSLWESFSPSEEPFYSLWGAFLGLPNHPYKNFCGYPYMKLI